MGNIQIGGTVRIFLQPFQEAVNCAHVFYKLGKILFPKNPRMVRYRKLQLLFFTVFLSVFAAAVVGVLYYLTYQLAGRR